MEEELYGAERDASARQIVAETWPENSFVAKTQHIKAFFANICKFWLPSPQLPRIIPPPFR